MMQMVLSMSTVPVSFPYQQGAPKKARLMNRYANLSRNCWIRIFLLLSYHTMWCSRSKLHTPMRYDPIYLKKRFQGRADNAPVATIHDMQTRTFSSRHFQCIKICWRGAWHHFCSIHTDDGVKKHAVLTSSWHEEIEEEEKKRCKIRCALLVLRSLNTCNSQWARRLLFAVCSDRHCQWATRDARKEQPRMQ